MVPPECRRPRVEHESLREFMPNPGSTSTFRHAYNARPAAVPTFDAIPSLAVADNGNAPATSGGASECLCLFVARYGLAALLTDTQCQAL